ncbi:hypothetical protein [Bradyrhizobium sp. JYMT SZCCT0428]|uniref:hypothetical protein n=1 Tax=Bradyrhizobium sp. JYMT SZCCT0428 TaxID=2807673 RepID=UPI001BA9B85C|nr:hypothetical protein [Bradyrhizobium sp. JYMT SZCCT0428]
MTIFTAHARKRCQQRGIPLCRVAQLLHLADIDKPAAKGCRQISVSRMVASTAGESSLVGITIIEAGDGALLTVKHQTRRRLGWRYPSGHRGHIVRKSR